MGLNDSNALEHEADVMGAKAAAYGDQESTPNLQSKTVQRSVIQARLPEMSEDQIQANKEVARELLLHSMRQIGDDEMEAMGTALRDGLITNTVTNPQEEQEKITKEDVTDLIRTTNSVTTLHSAYQYLITYTGVEKHFTMESDQNKAPDTELTQAILPQLSSVVSELGQVAGNGEVLENVFGVESAAGVIGIYRVAMAGISAHIKNKTCPVTLLGNGAHNAWVGVQGMTSYGSPVVQLSEPMAKDLASGGTKGKQTLVHEFTHAMGGTDDHAYSVADCSKLTPEQRIDNAQTYVFGYLEALGQHNDRYIYNPNVAVDEEQQNENDTSSEAKKKKMKGATKLATKINGTIDNIYAIAQKLVTDTLPEQEKPTAQKMVKAAVWPHNLAPNAENGPMVLALIEDRVKNLKKAKKELKEIVRAIPETELAGKSKQDILAEFVRSRLNISLEAAKKLVYYMEDYSRVINEL